RAAVDALPHAARGCSARPRGCRSGHVVRATVFAETDPQEPDSVAGGDGGAGGVRRLRAIRARAGDLKARGTCSWCNVRCALPIQLLNPPPEAACVSSPSSWQPYWPRPSVLAVINP